jgi:hypothetical protein
MRYLLLIYTDEAAESQQTPEEQQAVMQAYLAFGERFRAQIRGGEALQPTSTATMVRVRDGKTLTTDGPFAETKEQLGGYYVVEGENLDEAIALAAAIPGALHGAIEVRPILEFD